MTDEQIPNEDEPKGAQFIYIAKSSSGRESEFYGYFSTPENAKKACENQHEYFLERGRRPITWVQDKKDKEGRSFYANAEDIYTYYYVYACQLDVFKPRWW